MITAFCFYAARDCPGFSLIDSSRLMDTKLRTQPDVLDLVKHFLLCICICICICICMYM